MEFDGEDVQRSQHLNGEENDGEYDDANGYQFAEREAAAAWFHAAGSESQNVKSREGEYHDPKHVVGVPPWLAVENRYRDAKKQRGIGASYRIDRRRRPRGAGESGNRRCCSR